MPAALLLSVHGQLVLSEFLGVFADRRSCLMGSSVLAGFVFK